MKKITILIAVACFLIITPSLAITGSSYSIGGTTYYNFSDGTSGSSFNVGGTTHYNFSDGTNGTAYKISGTTYYNFSDPITGNLYNLGTGNNYVFKPIPDVDRYTTRGELLYEYCKGINYQDYPDFTKRGNELSAECLSNACPSGSCNAAKFSNELNRCLDEGAYKAFEEIKDICLTTKAKKYVDKVNATFSEEVVQKKTEPASDSGVNNKSGEDIFCQDGYILSFNKTYCVKIPEHAHPVKNSTDLWLCDDGYKEVGNSCILFGYQPLFSGKDVSDLSQNDNSAGHINFDEIRRDLGLPSGANNNVDELNNDNNSGSNINQQKSEKAGILTNIKSFFRGLFLKLSNLFK